MAHFAKLGIDNVVLAVLVVNNVDTMTPQGEEREEIGVEFLRKLTGHETWKQTSYTRSFRKNYAAVGFTYDSFRDAFIPPKPYPSWTLDEDTCGWNPPTPIPVTEGKNYKWNESTLSWDEYDLYS
jgi:hypothetical protein